MELRHTHTPGPWSRNIPPAAKYPVIFAGRNTHVAMVITNCVSADEAEANCNLIAAAPALLSALQETIDSLVKHLELVYHNKPGSAYIDEHPSVVAARAVIAKATGGQP